jgi:hypothetical protein
MSVHFISMCGAIDSFQEQSPKPTRRLVSLEQIMADDKTKRGAADRARINIAEDYELRDWAARFHITPERLKDAVTKVGPMAENVAKYLQKEF